VMDLEGCVISKCHMANEHRNTELWGKCMIFTTNIQAGSIQTTGSYMITPNHFRAVDYKELV